ncbi:MAG: hypothetical protein ACI9FJ_000369 [Alteromonadaceae bacterium]|jgi:hypothetical protein
MNNKHHHSFNGQLLRAPFVGKPSVALARTLPMSREEDFAVFTELPSSDTPIFINFIEHYQILSERISHANELWPEGLTILVRLSMPSGMRLPAPMLKDNVLLMQDVAPEVKRLKDAPGKLLVINDHLLRYQLEHGRNDIAISFYSDDNNDKAIFEQFIAPLAGLGIEPGQATQL